jgi:nucleotide-binding universal stress UspA family protein
MRVLLATDGSESSAVATALAGNIRWPPGTSLDVVRVVGDGGSDVIAGPWPATALRVPPDFQAAAIQDSEDALVALVEPLRELGLIVAHAVLRGQPAETLLDWIDRHRPDLVIVGNRGVSILERTLLGSVSAALIDRSPVPVLVARQPALARVVVAVDGSEIASEAVATVRRWPFLAMTEIRTLSVAPAPASWWPADVAGRTADVAAADRDAAADNLLEHDTIAAEAAAILRATGFTADSAVRAGSPASEIVAFAKEWNAELVIMGSHGRTGLARLLLGSVARSVLHHASCSVLVVRRHADPVRGKRVEAVARPWTVLATH